jgi:hypothetical protein
MHKLKPAFIVSTLAALGVFTALPLMAQQAQQRPSPPGIATATIDGGVVTLFYSRPYIKHPKTGETRKIWGGLVPYGQLWRTGANEATVLITEKPLRIGGATVAAGAYSIFTIPAAGGARLIINKKLGMLGTRGYDEKNDLTRVDMKRQGLDSTVDQFTIVLESSESGGGQLKLIWENAQYSVALGGGN